MNLLFIYFAGEHPYGYGHKFRAGTVMEAAHEIGSWVGAITNDYKALPYWLFGRGINGDMGSIHFMPALVDVLDSHQDIDWVVFDTPMPPPAEALHEAYKRGKKVATLHGVGLSDWLDKPQVFWKQDSARSAIVRSDIFKWPRRVGNEVVDEDKMVDWFVFGGAADVLDLANKFVELELPESANIVQTEVSARNHGTPDRYTLGTNKHVSVFGVDRDMYIKGLYYARKAAFHLGMSCWEFAALGRPMYIFSGNEDHLHDAKLFEERGLALAYPRVGVDDIDLVREFLQQPFTPTGVRPDGLGAYRFLDLLSVS